MTYLAFHLAFIIPPIIVFGWLMRRDIGEISKPIGLIILAAVVYTTPWDNYLVYKGVWGYGSNRVLGTIGYVPYEEYLFFILQPILAGLWFFWIRKRFPSDNAGHLDRSVGATVGLCLTIGGIVFLAFGNDRSTYLGLILAWFGPVVAGLSWIGTAVAWPQRKAMMVGIAVPTLWLWIADWTALHKGIWTILEAYSVGLNPLGLPIEEALFFLCTNWMVVMGLAMLQPAQNAHALSPAL